MCIDLFQCFDYLKKYTTVLIRKITIANYIAKMEICQTKNLDSDIFHFCFSRHFAKDDAQPNRLCYIDYNSSTVSTIGFRGVGGVVLIHVPMPAAAPSLLQPGLPLLREGPVLLPHAFVLQRESSALVYCFCYRCLSGRFGRYYLTVTWITCPD